MTARALAAWGSWPPAPGNLPGADPEQNGPRLKRQMVDSIRVEAAKGGSFGSSALSFVCYCLLWLPCLAAKETEGLMRRKLKEWMKVNGPSLRHFRTQDWVG